MELWGLGLLGGSGFRVQGSGLRAQGSGFRVRVGVRVLITPIRAVLTSPLSPKSSK